MRSLVIDLGNTNKKLAVFQNGRLTRNEQFPEFTLSTIKEFLGRYTGIDACILSSVIKFKSPVRRHIRKIIPVFIELGDKTPLPIINCYKSRQTLGRDRIAAAVAGSALFPNDDVLVINTGTCITYDFITKNLEYLGGAISPGIKMRFNSLHTFTDKLPLISFTNADILTGQTTKESILSGILTGATAEIEGIIQRYRQKYPDLKIVLSGGDYKYFVKRLNVSIFAVPNVVITGLYQILKFNVDQAD